MSKVAKMVVMLLCVVMLLSACATGTRFVLPEGTKVYIPTKDSAFSQGRARTRPFFWNSAGGIDYQLLKEGESDQTRRAHFEFQVVVFLLAAARHPLLADQGSSPAMT